MIEVLNGPAEETYLHLKPQTMIISDKYTDLTRRTFLMTSVSITAGVGLAGCTGGGSTTGTETTDRRPATGQDEATSSPPPGEQATQSSATTEATPQYPTEEEQPRAEQMIQSVVAKDGYMSIEVENPTEHVTLNSYSNGVESGTYEQLVQTVDKVDDNEGGGQPDGTVADHVDSYLVGLIDPENPPKSEGANDVEVPPTGTYGVNVAAVSDKWETGYSTLSVTVDQAAVERFYDENISGGVVQSWNMPDRLLELALE